jgi:hypothetical protein
VDVRETPATAPSALPDDVKSALKTLAEAGDQSGKLAESLVALKAGMSTELARIESRQREQLTRIGGWAVGIMVVAVALLAWGLRRRSGTDAAAAPANGSTLVLAPEHLATALVPAQDKMRNEMLGVLNEVAIKLQAQHNEQQKLVLEQQQQIESARQALADERRQFISEAGTMVVQAVERVDATTAKLARQQDKVAELVSELQNTVRELDQTKDTLRDREVELEKERAKIAALSLLLEDGGALPPPESTLAPRASDDSSPLPFATSRLNPAHPCTTPDPTAAATPKPLRMNGSNGAMPQFTFLPPHHPET